MSFFGNIGKFFKEIFSPGPRREKEVIGRPERAPEPPPTSRAPAPVAPPKSYQIPQYYDEYDEGDYGFDFDFGEDEVY